MDMKCTWQGMKYQPNNKYEMHPAINEMLHRQAMKYHAGRNEINMKLARNEMLWRQAMKYNAGRE